MGGAGGEVDVNSSGAMTTTGDAAIGIEAQSVGGGGGNGGLSLAATFGGGSTDPSTQTTQLNVSVGGSGGAGNVGGAVTVTNAGKVTTTGNDAYGIEAQSVGGGGGDGGASLAASVILGANKTGPNNSVAISIGGAGGSGNSGGAVVVDQTGGVSTGGDDATGIFAQSVGGGGGDGGSARSLSLLLGSACPPDNPECAAQNKTLDLSIGGNGGSATDGGTVFVTNQGDIATAGPDADGIFAQSVGGGGGTGGDAHLGLDNVGTLATLAGQNRSSFTKSLTIAVGGSGGASGNGNTVTVNNTGEITTAGAGSYGIFAQSVGGGGGEGGDGAIGALGKVGIGGAGGAAGDGGTVMVMQDGDITTSGDGATAIFAQSVGGGGGVAGNVDRGLATSMTEAGVTIPSVDIGIGLAFGQPGGSGGNGGDVTVSETGNIITTGIGADGIFAQSVGGGGGVAGNLGNTIGGTSLLGWTGSVGGTGNGGDVTVTENGNIYAYGDYSDGIYAQSAGGLGTGGAVNVTLDGSSAALGLDGVGIFAQSVGLAGNGDISVTIGSGGAAIGGTGPFSAGVILQDGAAHTIDNSGLIETLSGTDGTAISSLTGSTTINNNGAIVGSIYLGPGANVFNNNSGGSVYLGNYANNPLSTLTNTGPDALIEVVDGGTLDNQSATGTGFVNNGGTITVDAGGAVVTSTGDGVFRQNSGLTTVDGSWTQALTDLEGGQLAGSGTVNGTVFNNANPGAGPGQTGLNAGVFGVDPLTFTGSRHRHGQLWRRRRLRRRVLARELGERRRQSEHDRCRYALLDRSELLPARHEQRRVHLRRHPDVWRDQHDVYGCQRTECRPHHRGHSQSRRNPDPGADRAGSW